MNRPYRSSSRTFRTSPVSSVSELSIFHYWRCRTTAAGPPYNVSATFRRLKNSHNICPQLFSGNTRHVRESFHRETLPEQHSFQFVRYANKRCIGASVRKSYEYWFTGLAFCCRDRRLCCGEVFCCADEPRFVVRICV